MSEPTKDEKCRVIAEWLGWRLRDCVRDMTLKRWCKPGDDEQPEFGLHHPDKELPDFYLDEAASAAVLEAFTLPELERRNDGWHCKLYGQGFGITTVNPDRKTAIADAAYAYAVQHIPLQRTIFERSGTVSVRIVTRPAERTVRVCRIEKPEDIMVTEEMIEAGLEFYPVELESEYTVRALTYLYRAMRFIEIKNTEASASAFKEPKP